MILRKQELFDILFISRSENKVITQKLMKRIVFPQLCTIRITISIVLFQLYVFLSESLFHSNKRNSFVDFGSINHFHELHSIILCVIFYIWKFSNGLHTEFNLLFPTFIHWYIESIWIYYVMDISNSYTCIFTAFKTN